MATTPNGVDCAIELKGTGLPACVQELGSPIGFFKTPINWKLNIATETFDLSYIQTQVQNGDFVPFLESFNFTDNTEDTVFQTSQTGNESKVRAGKPKVMFEFQKGLCWHSSAYTHNTANCGIIYIWSNNVYGFRASEDGTELRAHRANYLDVGTFKNNDGANQFTTPIMIQFRNTEDYNAKMATVKGTDFDLSDINGVMDTTITVSVAPTPTGSTLSVKVVSACNPLLNISVLTAGQFLITGKTILSAPYNANTGFYDITINETFTLGEAYTVSLNDVTYDVVIIADQPYKGKSAELLVP